MKMLRNDDFAYLPVYYVAAISKSFCGCIISIFRDHRRERHFIGSIRHFLHYIISNCCLQMSL